MDWKSIPELGGGCAELGGVCASLSKSVTYTDFCCLWEENNPVVSQ